ncbi:MAG: hypothetical protein AB7F35_23625 [Acetobacteraceae bacterium]
MRIAMILTLVLALLTGACTTPDGRFDAPATLGLAAGLAAVGGLAYLATRDNDEPRYHRRGYHGGGYHGGGYHGGGYRGGGYYGWR